MSLSLNKVVLAGNLTRDPQVRFFANERAVADFGLAVNRKYKANDGTLKEETTFVDVEAWGRTAELIGQYLTKGRACYVEGRLKLDSWEDKKDGQKRTKLKVVADNVQFLDSNRGGERGGAGANANADAGERAASDEASDASPVSSKPAAASAAQPVADDEPPF
ncbi:MAG: single-stranded DNA-binding protein [Planctomycetes bacterium]|nr:single-stranded DNA-binding protein [Planctomycetota bacterium]